MKLIDFAIYVRSKLAPWACGVAIESYATEPNGTITATASCEPSRLGIREIISTAKDPLDGSVTVQATLRQILTSSAWCHAVAEDYVTGPGMASRECADILRAIAARCGKTID